MSGQPPTVSEKHQLAGVDERERGFNRLVEIARDPAGCSAHFRYEAVVVTTTALDSESAALAAMISLLQQRGYTQLRSRLSFKGTVYFGSQEEWIEYPDPSAAQSDGLWAKIVRMLGLSRSDRP